MARVGGQIDISTYVFFDTETTGLPSRNHNPKITELSFVALTREELLTRQAQPRPRVLCKLLLCFNPQETISPKVSEMTGIHNDALEMLSTFKQQAGVVRSFLATLAQPICLVAHNGHRFDFPLLKAELERSEHSMAFSVYCADSLQAFRAMDKSDGLLVKRIPYTRTPSYKLSEVYARAFGQQPEIAHTAEEDCFTILKIVRRRAPEFINWCETNAVGFETVKAMY